MVVASSCIQQTDLYKNWGLHTLRCYILTGVKLLLYEAGEMVQWLEVLTALLGGPSSVPSTHIGQFRAPYNSRFRVSQTPLAFAGSDAHRLVEEHL